MGDDTESTTLNESLPNFDDFIKGTHVAKRIDDIHRFTFRVVYQKTSALSDPGTIEVLRNDGYAVLNDLLESSAIHYLHSLEARPAVKTGDSSSASDEPLLEFNFSHDRQHCAFQFRENSFTILRQSSSFSDFYEWYRIIMPEALRIEMTFRQIIQRSTNRVLRPVQAEYTYVFDFCDFNTPLTDPSSGGKPRNMNVLEAIVPQLPGPHRTMARPADQELYRLDLTVMRREIFRGKARSTAIELEAPFNEGGRFIILTAMLRNASVEILEQNQIVGTAGFDPDFGTDYYIALMDFLRDEALESFAWQLFRNWEFDTERTI